MLEIYALHRSDERVIANRSKFLDRVFPEGDLPPSILRIHQGTREVSLGSVTARTRIGIRMCPWVVVRCTTSTAPRTVRSCGKSPVRNLRFPVLEAHTSPA